MRLPPYPAYRPSGEAWLPQIPDTWDLAALRWLSQRYSGGTPDKANSAFWDDGDIPWLNSGAVNDGYITEPSEYITREGFLRSSAKWIPKGALVMALAGQGKTKGMVAQLGIDATCNQSMAAIITTRRLQARYLYWWLTANYFNIRNMAGGEARDGLNLDLLGRIPCPLPNEGEQRSISMLLDRETAKIDTLVAKKRTLIERLQEKRTALISRAVTRGLPPHAARAAGLNPHPKLKPTGITWLGDVPVHWKVVALGRITDSRCDGPFGSGLKSEHYTDDGTRVVRLNNIRFARFDGADAAFIDTAYAQELGDHGVEPGDLLIAGLGDDGHPVGRACVAPAGLGPAMVKADCFRFRLAPTKASPGFVAYQLSSTAATLAGALATGTTRSRMNLSETARRAVALPPTIDEQRSIADFLDRETARIEGMVTNVETAIERLQEYRTALITAAVTGKIDVRAAVA